MQKPPSQVFANLYLGSEFNASYRQELVERNVRSLLNCAYPQVASTFYFEPSNFTVRAIQLYDGDEENIAQYWKLTYEFIDECRESDTACLVYCKTGNNRSAAIVAAYIMMKTRATLIETLRHLRSIRSTIEIRKGFLWQLGEMEMELLGFSSIQHPPRDRILTPEVVGLPYSSLIPSLSKLVVEEHGATIEQHVADSLAKDDWNAAAALFLPLRLIPDIARMVRRNVFNHVKGQLVKMFEKAGAPRAPTPGPNGDFLAILAHIKALYTAVITQFNGDPSILNAVNQGITSVVKTNTQLVNKLSALYIATKTGNLYAPGGPSLEATAAAAAIDAPADPVLEHMLNAVKQVVPLLRNAENDRLLFEETYLLALLKRFVARRQVNEDFEFAIVVALRQFGLTKIADDIQTALSDFKTSALVKPRNSNIGARVEMQAFNVERWPTHFLLGPLTKSQDGTEAKGTVQQTTAVLARLAKNLPPDLFQLWTDYASSEFFAPGSPLQKFLVPHLGTCEIVFNTHVKKFKVVVSTPMMMVLSLFDEMDVAEPSTNVQAILAAIDLPADILLSAIYSMSCEPIPKCTGGSGNLLVKRPASATLAGEDELFVNTAFTSLLRSIRVPSKKYTPK